MFFISESWYISGTVNGCVSHHKALSRRQFVGWLCDWIEKRGPSSWRFIYLLNDLMGEQYIKVVFVTFKDTKETGWSRSGKQEILPEVITASVSSNVISTSPQLMVVLENPYYQIFTETLQKKKYIYIYTYVPIFGLPPHPIMPVDVTNEGLGNRIPNQMKFCLPEVSPKQKWNALRLPWRIVTCQYCRIAHVLPYMYTDVYIYIYYYLFIYIHL